MQTEHYPSKDCDCHWMEPYGFVPEADCSLHDTKEFLDFIAFVMQRANKGVLK